MSTDTIRVLLVEDSPSYARLLQGLLAGEDESFSSYWCASFRDAEEWLQENRPDVVLLDLHLPDADGTDTFHDFRERFPNLPVIVVTSEDNRDLAARAVRAGAQDYLAKGEIGRGELHRAVRYAIERSRAETQLRLSEARLRALVDHAAFGIFRSDLAGHFLSVNPALVRMLGYENEQEVLELDIARDVFVDPDARARLMEHLRSGERLDAVEAEWRRADGSSFHVRLTGRPVMAGPRQPRYFEGFVEDISERRLLEERAREAQKLSAVGLLAAGIAHEINNLFAVIRGSAELLQAAVAEDTEALADLDEIVAAVDRGAELVRQIRGYGRQEALRVRTVAVGEVVEDALRLVRRTIHPRHRLTFTDASAGARAMADPAAVTEVLHHVVRNASEAMGSGDGSIDISVGVTHDAEHRPHCVRVSVSDAGIGMDEATRARIFEPFFSTKERGSGTGLGLATVWGLMQQQGGSVEVDSEPGEGTTVHLFFEMEGAPRSGFDIGGNQEDDAGRPSSGSTGADRAGGASSEPAEGAPTPEE